LGNNDDDDSSFVDNDDGSYYTRNVAFWRRCYIDTNRKILRKVIDVNHMLMTLRMMTKNSTD